MKTYIYDIELYPNYFCVTFVEYEDYIKNRLSYVNAKTFEDKQLILDLIPVISFEVTNNKSDIIKLLAFLQQEQFYLVGYNNNKFDNMIINYIQMYAYNFKSPTDILNKLYAYMLDIITIESIWIDDKLKAIYYYGSKYRSIDLMQILGFDKKENRRSLKQIAININWYWIQELPIKPGTTLTDEQIPIVLTYNRNDVFITAEIFYTIRKDISLRRDIEIKYQTRVLSLSDSAIADTLFFKMYSELTGITYHDFKQGKTYRSWIDMSKCINPDIKFVSDDLNKILNKLKNRKIQKTKGEIDVKFNIGNTIYQVATGGLHSKDKPAKWITDNDTYLIDADVKYNLAS